ncbi:MAG: hypothetical protein APR63_06965 [Desulfuromonas sp. SDB]|nr:MAG: hypothetical protein APR63_06965 [Desulfuromonas sp. SDB]
MAKLFDKVDVDSATPFLRQYLKEKSEYPHALLLFRMGDFYETFYEDAQILSEVTGIALTSRPAGKDNRIPLAGIPVKAAQTYIHKLIQGGHRVAICEQLEPPQGKLIKRKVVRVITPGTSLDPDFLQPHRNCYLCSVVIKGKIAGIAYAEVASGEFYAGEVETDQLEEQLNQLNPTEVLTRNEQYTWSKSWLTTVLDKTYYTPSVRESLLRHLGVLSLQGFGIEANCLAEISAAALFEYLNKTTQSDLKHIKKIIRYDPQDFMVIDNVTFKNLEIFESSRGDQNYSLANILDFTKLASGRRTLRRWLNYPLVDRDNIEKRLDAVAAFINNQELTEALVNLLTGMIDPMRLGGRLGTGKATVTELIKLREILQIIPQIKHHLGKCQVELVKQIEQNLNELPALRDILERALGSPDNSGSVIRSGYHPEFDQLNRQVKTALETISLMEKTEKEKTGINSLKIKYNALIGYYIEVTKPNLSQVPPEYQKKQWLSNAERFTTPQLTELQNTVINGQEKLAKLEQEILDQLRERCGESADKISYNGQLLSDLDVLLSFAQASSTYQYTRPVFTDKLKLELKASRHPVVERKNVQEDFIPNDLNLTASADPSLIIITGPNMSGKSTYLRQTAVLTIIAQAGCFVPAQKMELGIVDKLFSRIGASDDISKGISTFMAEMIETANILNNVTPRSLVILDEIGRGTSTFDGISIAWSVAEYIHNRIGCRTLFATHYHELAGLADQIKGIENFNVAVVKKKNRIIFLRSVVPGASSHSYGIQVSRLAGLPAEVIARAEQVLTNLERTEVKLPAHQQNSAEEQQLSLFRHPVVEELQSLDPDKLTPLQALNILHELKKTAQK